MQGQRAGALGSRVQALRPSQGVQIWLEGHKDSAYTVLIATICYSKRTQRRTSKRKHVGGGAGDTRHRLPKSSPDGLTQGVLHYHSTEM